MTQTEQVGRKRILDPIDRLTEAIFGLVMVLTFTCTFSAVESTRADVKELMLATIGCNVAWGLVDGVMYLVARLTQRRHLRALFDAARGSDREEAAKAIAAAVPPAVVTALGDRGIEDLRRGLETLPAPAPAATVTLEDCLGALGIFLIAVLTVAPLLLPFALMREPHQAMRVSNAIALLMLFFIGQQWASLIGMSRWRTGIAMALGGTVIVAITIALGG